MVTSHIAGTSVLFATATAQVRDVGEPYARDTGFGGWLWLVLVALVVVGGLFYLRSRSRRGPLP